jgi:hypothetical protein
MTKTHIHPYIVLAIVLFYLIARPHIGTVWDLTAPTELTPTPRPTCGPNSETPPPGVSRMSECADDIARGLTPLPPGLTPLPTSTTPLPTPLMSRFYSQGDCWRSLVNTIFEPHYRCIAHAELLWGWSGADSIYPR